MDKIKLKNTIIFLMLFLFFGIKAFSYNIFPTAVLKSNVDKMDVGETISVDVFITIPEFVELLKKEKDIFIDGWEIQDLMIKENIADKTQYTLKLFITTFNSKINKIPKIRFACINKNEDNESKDKFYFFSNSVPIQVNSIVKKYDKNTIFDIKSIKMLPMPISFYVLCLLFLLFVISVIYTSVLKFKIKRNIKIYLSPKENAIRKLNNIIYCKNFDVNEIKEYCFLTSEALRLFILDNLRTKNIGMTTDELLSVISKEDNIFYNSYSQISYFFKKYDEVKYSTSLLYANLFVDVFNKTKSYIQNFDI